MRPKTAIILLICAVLMAGFVLFIEPYLARKHKSRAPQPVIPGFAPETITNIYLTYAGTNELNLIKSNDAWVITKPFTYPANGDLVQSFLRIIAEMDDRLAITPQKQDDFAEFGLHPPRYTIELRSDSHTNLIQIGARTPLGDAVYVTANNNKTIYLTTALLLQCLPRSLDDWRDRSIILAKELKCNRLQLTLENTPIELELYGNPPRWRIVKPLNARADSQKINRMLGQLTSARIKRFLMDQIPNTLEEFGLQAPRAEIAIAINSNVTAKIKFGSPADDSGKELYALREHPPLLFTVASDDVRECLTKLDALRDPRLIEFDAQQIKSIEIVGEQHFALQMADSGSWQVVGSNSWEADQELARQLCQTIATIEIFQFAKQVATEYDLPNFGLDHPSRKYILHFDPTKLGGAPQESIELHFGKVEGNRVYAHRLDETSIYAIRITDYNKLPWAPWQLRNRKPWQFDVDKVSRIKVKQGPHVYEFLRTGTNIWTQAAGPSFQLNPFAIEETAYRLGQLTMVSWVATGKQALPQFGFTPEPDAVTIETKDGKKFTLTFGGPTPFGSLFGAVELDGDIWIGELPRAICEFVKTYLTAPES